MVRYYWGAFILLFISCSSSKFILSDSIEDIQSYIDSIRVDFAIPGMSVAIIDKQEKISAFTTGWSDKEDQIAMDPHHVLMNGSIGKTYVAAVLFKLIESNQIELDDPISKYLNEYGDLDRIPNAALLTIAHLMTHTSGIPRYVMDPAVWSFVKDDPMRSWTPEERLAFILDADPLHAPGEAWAYSDTNYILLGMIIEKITGRKYNDLVREMIIEFYQFNETYVNDRFDIPNLSAAYSGLGQLFHVKEKVASIGAYSFNPQIEWTGGGISTTPRDLAKWTLKLHQGGIVSPESYQTMITSSDVDDQFPDGSKYGHGCILWVWDGNNYYGHSGIMPGFLSITLYAPKFDYALAIQVNTDQLPPGKSLTTIAQGLNDILQKDE